MILPDHVYAVKDRHGKLRYRFVRKSFPSQYLYGHPESEEFQRQYAELMVGQGPMRFPIEPRWRPYKGVEVVYFIGPKNGPIKIGTTTDCANRLRRLQTGHPEKLEIWTVARGGQELEATYHNVFKTHRLNGEWFERAPIILDEMDRLSLLPFSTHPRKVNFQPFSRN